MEDYGDELEDGLEDELEDTFEMEGFEDEDAYEGGFEAYDGFESDAYEDYAVEEAIDDVLANALGAEESDEFLGSLWKGLKHVGRKVVAGIKRAAPVVGKIASGVSRVASMIPTPYTQAIGRIAGIVGKAANLAQRLKAEGASEEDALEAFAEMAAKDPRALPIVAGLTARTILKRRGAHMSHGARKHVVKQVKAATHHLVSRRGLHAVRAMPKIAKTVKRNAIAKGVPPAATVKVLRRTAAKVAKSPALTRRLARPNPAARRIVHSVAGVGTMGALTAPRTYVLSGPARITISAA
jgi:hypothetical protein